MKHLSKYLLLSFLSTFVFTIHTTAQETMTNQKKSNSTQSLQNVDTPTNAVEMIPDVTHKNVGNADNSSFKSGQINPPPNFITTKKEVDMTQHKINPNVVMNELLIDQEIEALKKEKKNNKNDITYVNDLKKQIQTLKARKQYLRNNNLLLK